MMDVEQVRQSIAEQLREAEQGLDLLRALAVFSGGAAGLREGERLAALLGTVRLAREQVEQGGQPSDAPAQATSEPDPREMSVLEQLAGAIVSQRTITLSVWRGGGSAVEEVEYEPYALQGGYGPAGQRTRPPTQPTRLLCWHVAHTHWERLQLAHIRYVVRVGGWFTPRAPYGGGSA